jgi:hypothetical protein
MVGERYLAETKDSGRNSKLDPLNLRNATKEDLKKLLLHVLDDLIKHEENKNKPN